MENGLLVTCLCVAILIFQKPYLVNLYRNTEEDQKGRKRNISVVVLHELLSQSKIGATISVNFSLESLGLWHIGFVSL